MVQLWCALTQSYIVHPEGSNHCLVLPWIPLVGELSRTGRQSADICRDGGWRGTSIPQLLPSRWWGQQNRESPPQPWHFLLSVVYSSRGEVALLECGQWRISVWVLIIEPQENLHVWFTEEEVRSWSLKAQKQAGYVLDGPFLGYVDHHNAIDMFRANKNQASIPDMV